MSTSWFSSKDKAAERREISSDLLSELMVISGGPAIKVETGLFLDFFTTLIFTLLQDYNILFRGAGPKAKRTFEFVTLE
jgi:hypothetical protein